MKKILLFSILALVLIFNVVVGAETGKKEIKIGFFDVPPHIYFDEKAGQIKGAAYEFLEKYIAPEINVKFVWDKVPTVIPRQLELLDKEKEFASALLVYTPERAQKYIFPEMPYAAGQPSLALLKSNKLDKITKVEDIADLVIGYGNNAFISPFMRNDKIKFELVSSPDMNEVNFKKLQAGRIGAVYTPDKGSLLFFMKQMNLDRDFKIISLPENPSVYNIVFTPSLKDVAESYNKAFKRINGQKIYLSILSKYIDTAKL